MKLRTNLGLWRGGLLLALGLTVAAGCSSTSDGDAGSFPCNSPQARGAGYENCDGGWVHRPEILSCTSSVPRTGEVCSAGGQCSTDAECSAQTNSFCAPGIQIGCHCRAGCTSDSECGTGQICLCGDPVGTCVSATCTSDADCGEGMMCASHESGDSCGFGIVGFACQTAEDECVDSKDCAQGQSCVLREKRRICAKTNPCAAGRPFLVRDEVRLAQPESRGDWQLPLPMTAADLPESVRTQLKRWWTDVGLMEHASVAAFARFSLQLLALGAPASLVSESQQAMGDEIEHARICFGLASHYGAAPVGPGVLPSQGALDGQDSLEAVVRLTFREGCIGETCAALEAEEAASHCQDAAVSKVLRRIAQDELRHAALAWRFIQWALDTSGGSLDHIIDEEVARARAQSVPVAETPNLLAFGVPSPALRAELRDRAVEEVVGPCARALIIERAAAA